MHAQFFIDFLGVIPWQYADCYGNLGALKVLRLFRLLKMLSLIRIRQLLQASTCNMKCTSNPYRKCLQVSALVNSYL